jgi:undecaprenyl-diphosphatase
MVPVAIVGWFLKIMLKDFLAMDCCWSVVCLLVTAVLLTFSYYAKPRLKEDISYKDAFIIGVAQCLAVLPGLSRSGSTIATGLLLGNKKELVAKFSFLMVIIPILGESVFRLA